MNSVDGVPVEYPSGVSPLSCGTLSFRTDDGTSSALVSPGDGAIDWLESDIEGSVREQSDLKRGNGMSAVLAATACVSADESAGRLVSCLVEDLRPHPSLVRLQLVPSARDLSDAVSREGRVFREPLTITQDGYILAGQAEWTIARKRGEKVLNCFQLSMTEEEILLWLIQKHQRSSRLNDFNRIVLALELEPWFKSRARSNQRLGGQIKGSSSLTEADKVDVRAEIAAAAGVSVGNISKVKGLISNAIPDVLEALRDGEVSIHRASSWLSNLEIQLDELRWFRDRRGLQRTISTLQSRHRTARPVAEHGLNVLRIANAMLAMVAAEETPVLVREVQIPGKALLLSSELVRALEVQGELQL